MLLFETASVVISLIMMAVVGISGGVIKSGIHSVIIKVALYAVSALFILNTIGNFNSQNQLEKNISAPITLLLSLFCLVLILTQIKKLKIV